MIPQQTNTSAQPVGSRTFPVTRARSVEALLIRV
jgi:hypothetical protein